MIPGIRFRDREADGGKGVWELHRALLIICPCFLG